MTAEELVNMLHDEKGVAFSIMDASHSIVYLSTTNNYLRTASYRKNYLKHTSGPQVGKYIDLDFAYLAELSTLDMHLRSYLLKMSIALEHALKVNLLSIFERQPSEDGYSIVTEYLGLNPQVVQSIESKIDTIFTGGLIDRYFDLCYVCEPSSTQTRIMKSDCPIWVLVELLSFGELLNFYDYCARKYSQPLPEWNVLNPVKSLRNACAHNNCILYCLAPDCNKTQPPSAISQFVAKMNNIGVEERKKKLSCRPMFEITCLLYMYCKVVSPNVFRNGIAELQNFTNGRLVKHKDYFEGNQLLSTSIGFLQKLVDNLT
ncbi:MAG: Abi family protein [Christensenella sp.]|nr:Abi family protein [Christensenella sp.]